MIQSTPLHATHIAQGAKLVEFSGWDMPIHYGSQIAEHHAVRKEAGMFDVSHMTVVDVQGADAQAYLRKLLANDVSKLRETGAALYSCMLNANGGVIDDLITYHFAADDYRLIVNAATREKDLAWMQSQTSGFAVEILPRNDHAMIAVQGPTAREIVHKCLPFDIRDQVAALKRFSAFRNAQWFVGRTGYTGEDGYEIVAQIDAGIALWEALAANDVAPAGLGARDTLRLEAGMALYGNDLDEDTSPLESGLRWTVDFADSHRQFNGRDSLQAQIDTGGLRKMVGLTLEGRGVLRSHQDVYLGDDCVGEITSGTFSPSLGATIALARVSDHVNNQCDVDIRGKRIPARIVGYPFVKSGVSSAKP
ncbi:MAG: glycine cleavage system aminomethyltransferase GcvT [Pseudomonadota bacterium]